MTQAPKHIPGELYDGYSMNGQINIGYSYRNDCGSDIQKMMNSKYTQEEFDECVRRIQSKEVNYYGPTDQWLYEAFDKYPLTGQHVCIAGSAYPWYEAMATVFGASHCTVIEYADRVSFHPSVEYIKPHEMTDVQYDACLSISSYEHDGLGRYGDPLNPTADLETMQKMKTILKKDGLMYLAVPTGYDYLYFNVHRVYGKQRFPKLIEGWEVVDRFGFFDDTFTNMYNTGEQSPYQPLCVLRNS